MLSLWANWLQLNSVLHSPGVSNWLYRRPYLIWMVQSSKHWSLYFHFHYDHYSPNLTQEFTFYWGYIVIQFLFSWSIPLSTMRLTLYFECDISFKTYIIGTYTFRLMTAIESAGIIKVHCEQLFIGHMIEIIARFLNIFHSWVSELWSWLLEIVFIPCIVQFKKKTKTETKWVIDVAMLTMEWQ